MRADWTASGACTNGSTAPPKGATRPASGGAATMSTRASRSGINARQKTAAHEQQITGTEITRKKTEQTIWNYYGKDREKHLAIGPEFLFVQRTKYSTYEDFKKEFFDVLSRFLEAYPETVISRFGIRYVNDIRLDEANAMEWDRYLNPK